MIAQLAEDKIVLRMTYNEYQRYGKPIGFIWQPKEKVFISTTRTMDNIESARDWFVRHREELESGFEDVMDFLNLKMQPVSVEGKYINVRIKHQVLEKIGKKTGEVIKIKDCYAARFLIDRFLGTNLLEHKQLNEGLYKQALEYMPDFLFEYQIEGVQWIIANKLKGMKGSLLADDMGLGKTVQSLAAYHVLKAINPNTKLFVIAPKSTITNAWCRDAKKFFNIDLTQLEAGDIREKPDVLLQDGIITNYESLIYGLNPKTDLRLTEDHFLVLDEATKVKNYNSQMHKIIKRIRGNAFVLALSGTPLENNLGEFYSIMNIIDPDFMTFKIFSNLFVVFQQKWFGSKMVNMIVRHKNLTLFYEMAKEYMLRRAKERAVKLPAKNITKITVPLSDTQASYIEKVKHLVKTSNINNETIEDVVTLTLIRRIEDDVRLLKYTDSKIITKSMKDAVPEEVSPKLKMLLELIDPQKKTVIFTEYSDMAELIRQELEAAGIPCLVITGSDNLKSRNSKIKQFQENINILIATDALTYGVNLHFADVLINYDIPWNPGKRAQRIDRIYRVGIKNEKYVYDLVTDGIETIVYDIIINKLMKFAEAVEGKVDASESSIVNQIAKKVLYAKGGVNNANNWNSG